VDSEDVADQQVISSVYDIIDSHCVITAGLSQ